MSRVILWSAPRSLSTVFERSICELENVRVVHEPHRRAFWSGKENCGSRETFEEARQVMLEEAQLHGSEHVFFKEMAYYISGRFSDYVGGKFCDFKHSFLIRHPFSTALSLQRVWMVHEETNKFFYSQSLGFEELYNLYEIVRTVDSNPLIIKAEDIQMNPM